MLYLTFELDLINTTLKCDFKEIFSRSLVSGRHLSVV